jgi:hypothetical protein
MQTVSAHANGFGSPASSRWRSWPAQAGGRAGEAAELAPGSSRRRPGGRSLEPAVDLALGRAGPAWWPQRGTRGPMRGGEGVARRAAGQGRPGRRAGAVAGLLAVGSSPAGVRWRARRPAELVHSFSSGWRPAGGYPQAAGGRLSAGSPVIPSCRVLALAGDNSAASELAGSSVGQEARAGRGRSRGDRRRVTWPAESSAAGFESAPGAAIERRECSWRCIECGECGVESRSAGRSRGLERRARAGGKPGEPNASSGIAGPSSASSAGAPPTRFALAWRSPQAGFLAADLLALGRAQPRAAGDVRGPASGR